MKNFSSIYYPDLDPYEQQYNDIWFMQMLSRLTLDGILFIPDLNKSFNKKGEEINDNRST
jgi:hypothetical protein